MENKRKGANYRHDEYAKHDAQAQKSLKWNKVVELVATEFVLELQQNLVTATLIKIKSR